ncbi:MAG: enoyl-CoA hydratase-related protein [Proteobacteria bacterium]|nr:enoyl-CoA hydratase-related protein [Pseudomonadota bacterium]MDA1070748.1 enoyl-CoA hydratase-related protein [Pseudomonadota bacterium]
MSDEVLYEAAERIARITINRPARMNTLNPPMMAELSAALLRAEADDAVSVIVLTSTGDHFGAGYDLKYDWNGHYGHDLMGMRRALKASVDFEFGPWDCAKPVIAMVRGYCLAGSCELAMMCCITFAARSAKFGEPEIRFSTAPPAMIMPWLIGLKRTRELLYTGDMIGAQEACEAGMVNRVFDDGALEDETVRYARRAAAISREGLMTTKAAINRSAEVAGLREAIAYGIETATILDCSETEQFLQFEAVRKEQGLSAAIRWRESQFA